MGEDKIFQSYPHLPEMVVAFIRQLAALIVGKNAKLSEQKQKIKVREQEIFEQQQKILENEQEISVLKERLAHNSGNSSMPTSSDKPGEKPNRNNSLRPKGGKKPGGQPGHK